MALRASGRARRLLEMLDGPTSGRSRRSRTTGSPTGCAAVLLVQSDRPGHAAADVQRYAALLADAGAPDVAVADDAQEAEALMAAGGAS